MMASRNCSKKRLPFLEQENDESAPSITREMNKNWWFWRPVVAGVVTYTEAIQMSKRQLLLANAALDRRMKEENTPPKKGGKK